MITAEKCSDYNVNKIKAIIEKAFDNFYMNKKLFSGASVLVKPNLLAPRAPELAVTTHPAVFEALIMVLKDFSINITAGDSPALGRGTRAAEKCGILDICKKYNVPFADFSKDPVYVKVDSPRACSGFTVAQAAAQADVIINMPKMKTHCQTLYTGAVKNMFGLIPDTKKAAMHFRFKKLSRFSDMLADLVTTFKPDLSIMDAIMAMEGQGPGTGDPIKSNFIAVSDDPVYLDSFCCSIAGINPSDVEILVQANLAGLGNFADMEQVRQEFSHLVTRNFKLPETRSSLLRVVPLPEKITSFLSNFMMKSPVINSKKCISCGKCEQICPANPKAIFRDEKKGSYQIDLKRCIRCYCCHEVCPQKAVLLKRKLF